MVQQYPPFNWGFDLVREALEERYDKPVEEAGRLLARDISGKWAIELPRVMKELRAFTKDLFKDTKVSLHEGKLELN